MEPLEFDGARESTTLEPNGSHGDEKVTPYYQLGEQGVDWARKGFDITVNVPAYKSCFYEP